MATLIVCIILSYCLLLPTELEDFASSAIAAISSVSNIYFWNHTDYFDVSSGTKPPLLHTWSLAVEEQFYVLLPILLVVLGRWRRASLSVSVTLLTLTSLALSAMGAYWNPQSTFYLAHTRAWEFLVGILIALDVFPTVHTATMRNVVSCAGLGLISIAVFAFSTDTAFPGLAALVPCVGAALIIAAGRSGASVVANVLSLRLLTFIGLISYSLYLWHWPIFVLLHISGVLSQSHAPVTRAAVIVATIAIAAISWRYIEMPFRVGPRRPSRSTLFKLAGTGHGSHHGVEPCDRCHAWSSFALLATSPRHGILFGL
jgi:peptidoglycan/LPS O-acetylase OafA/YrhL